MTQALIRRQWPSVLAAVALGIAAGGLIGRMPLAAAMLAAVIAAGLGLVLLGDRALVWSTIAVAVIPWYPLSSAGSVAPPLVPQRIFCAVIAAALLVPWLWAAADRRAHRRPSRIGLLYGLAFPCLALGIYQSVGAVKPLISSTTFGLLFGGAAFFAARRVGSTRPWGAAAFSALCVLLAVGLFAYARDPGERVGDFTGYPITYGALLATLLPSGTVWALARSRVLAAGLVAMSCGLMILSQSRSSWIATVMVLLVLVALLVRQRRWRELRGVAALASLACGLVLVTGSLHGIVERKLSADQRQTDSVTHRVFGYGYAKDRIAQRPVFGGGAPGFSQQEVADETGIGALDNGYLSITVDTGLFGLLTVLIPILIALATLGRWLVRRTTPPPEDLALALGVVGLAVVTAFYDSFYWAQLSLLLFAMGGALSSRWGVRPADDPGSRRLGRARAVLVTQPR